MNGESATEKTCDLHRPGAVYIGRCIYFEERLGLQVCNHKNGPQFCTTGGRERCQTGT